MKNIKGLLISGIILIVVVLLVWYALSTREAIADMVIDGDYNLSQDEELVLGDNQRLVVKGNLDVQGTITCENGGLTIIAKKDATISGNLKCERAEELDEQDAGLGISLVVARNFTMTETAKVETSGSIQIVNDEQNLMQNIEDIEKMSDEIVSDTGDGNRIGPFIKNESEENQETEEKEDTSLNSTKKLVSKVLSVSQAKAQVGATATISGQMWVNQPPKKVKQIVLFWFPNISTINIQDFKLIGPDGRDGESDEGNSCNAKGKNGSDAMRFFAFAPNMRINNFELMLGHGGNGGEAETKKDCDPGKAVGGEGGKSGNFKIIGTQGFDIQGAFIVHPGWAGDGGNATAYGKDGGPSENGGDAVATGGDAEDNIKAIRVQGTVNGTNLVQIGSLYGGNGGDATAVGGKGGDGPECKSQDGGKGGDATVKPGDGGDAKIVLSGTGAGRTTLFEDVAGDSGDRDAQPGNGGNGSKCSPKKPGGNGGAGGNAILKDGKHGVGATRNGQAGQTTNQRGGDAGNGGDGCLPGEGGTGGSGNPNGVNGVIGKNICPVEEKKEDTTGKVGDDVKPEEPKDEPKVDPESEVIPEPTGVCAPGEVLCNQCENACPPEQCYQNPATGCYFCE